MEKTITDHHTEIVEIVEEEIYNSDIVDNMDEGALTID